MARAAAAKPHNASARPYEPVDPSVYEGWDFDRINREARGLRELEREKGRDAVVSKRRGSATAVGRKRDA